ncbi:hypothetical protein [Streptomyces sp. NBC_01462]|uniref:hypothetical protein n=1 Tax=Streptomyces sp. NBC_01462 TaxID=2903876 RepID=UPI002E31C208|nr:hypothetical protein [Streptomyces sp. NBC_01462]
MLYGTPGRDSIDGGRLRDHEHMESWTIKHFSQANPEGTGQDDVPALLRRVADSIEVLGLVEVQDLVMHTEITADGYRPSLTVYFHDAED